MEKEDLRERIKELEDKLNQDRQKQLRIEEEHQDLTREEIEEERDNNKIKSDLQKIFYFFVFLLLLKIMAMIF